MNDPLDNSSPKKLSSGPKTRVCYVCGRQYGLHSFEIHLKQCKELWIAREAEKDPKERKKLPEDPMLKLTSSISSNEDSSLSPAPQDLEEINRLSTAAFNTESLDTCKFCGRTFLAEKLLIHNRSCTEEHPARKLTEAVKRGVAAPAISSPADRPRTSQLKQLKKIGDNYNDKQDDGDIDSENGVTNLKIENGALVGHLGGSSGRTLRNDTKKIKDSNNIFKVAELKDKDEIVSYLCAEIDRLENLTSDFQKSLSEVKSVMEKLRQVT